MPLLFSPKSDAVGSSCFRTLSAVQELIAHISRSQFRCLNPYVFVLNGSVYFIEVLKLKILKSALPFPSPFLHFRSETVTQCAALGGSSRGSAASIPACSRSSSVWSCSLQMLLFFLKQGSSSLEFTGCLSLSVTTHLVIATVHLQTWLPLEAFTLQKHSSVYLQPFHLGLFTFLGTLYHR